VAGCCEHGDEPSDFVAKEFVYKYKQFVSFPQGGDMLLAVSQWFPLLAGTNTIVLKDVKFKTIFPVPLFASRTFCPK
jgi:hypothetical protein